MRIGLVRRQQRDSSRPVEDAALAERVVRHAQSQGHETRIVDFEDLGLVSGIGSRHVPEVDCIISMSRELRMLRPLAALHELGVPIINRPLSVLRTANRPSLFARLHTAGLPVPSTLWGNVAGLRTEMYREKPDDRPFIGIPATNGSLASGSIRQLHLTAVAEYKVYVIGDSVVSVAERPKLPDVVARVALAAAACVGLDVASVDVIRTEREGSFVIDVNDFPSFRGVVDAARLLVDLAARQSGQPS